MDIFNIESYKLFIQISRWFFLKLANVWGEVWIKFSFYRRELRMLWEVPNILILQSHKNDKSWKGLGLDFLPYIVDLFLSQYTVYTSNQSHLSPCERERRVLKYTCHGIQPCSEICCSKNSFMVGKTTVPLWLCYFLPCSWNVLSVYREKN